MSRVGGNSAAAKRQRGSWKALSSHNLEASTLLRAESFIVERLRREGVPVYKVSLGQWRIMHHKFAIVDGR